jgi:methionine sulfoxide reductase heme-binding subunit
MSNQTFWYIARASGLLAWALMTAAVVLGILMGARLVKSPSKAWQTDLHRFLGGLAVVFVGVHIFGLVADSYVHFGWAEVLFPMASTWRPLAVAAGIVAMYLLVAVETTSLLKKHLPKQVWKAIHFSSYPLFVLTTLHAITAGTDTRTTFMALVVAVGVIVLGALTVARLHAAEEQLDLRDARRDRLTALAARR